MIVPDTAFVSKMERTKNGSNEGTTVRRHRSIPSAAPNIAVLLSKISAAIPIEDMHAVIMRLRLLIPFTSQENMRAPRKELRLSS